jgi:hypothetical protein
MFHVEHNPGLRTFFFSMGPFYDNVELDESVPWKGDPKNVV